MKIRKIGPAWPSLVAPVFILTLIVLRLSFSFGAINPDGIAYLDMARFFLAGDFFHFVNAYRSPLYPILIAITMKLLWFLPHAFAAISVTNCMIFLLAYWNFERLKKHFLPTAATSTTLLFGDLASILFILCAYSFIGLSLASPDLLTLALYLWTCERFLILWKSDSPKDALLFSLALVTGCFARELFFYITPAFFVAYLLKKRAQLALIVIVAWMIPLAPYVATLSYEAKRLSIGCGATKNMKAQLNYSYTKEDDWLIKLNDFYPTYVFPSRTAVGTFPLLYNPCAWDARMGAVRNTELWSFAKYLLARNLWGVHDLIGHPLALLALIAGVAFLIFHRERRNLIPAHLKYLAIPSVWAILLLTISIVEARYVAPYLFVLLLIFFRAFFDVPVKNLDRIRALVAMSLILFLAFDVQKSVRHEKRRFRFPEAAAIINQTWQSKPINIAVVGDPYFEANWAALLDMKIRAYLNYKREDFYYGNGTEFRRLVAQLRKRKIDYVITRFPAKFMGEYPWKRVLGFPPLYAYATRKCATSQIQLYQRPSRGSKRFHPPFRGLSSSPAGSGN